MAKRRANGEGSIRKRKDGRWEGRFTAGRDPLTGKPIYKNVLGKTQGEVKDKLKTELEKVKRLDYIRAEEITVGEWVEIWLQNYGKMTMHASTYETYEGNLRIHVRPKIGDIKLCKLTSLKLQQFFKALLENGRIARKESAKQPKGLSVKTVSNIRTMLYSAFEKAIAEKLLQQNPCAGCKLPKEQKKEMRILDPEQIGRFFEEARNSGKYEFYYTELMTGLRRGELLGLKWSDVNFREQTVTVQRQILRVNGEVKEYPLKTKNAYRVLALPDQMTELFRHMKAQSVSPYLFPSPTGEAQDPDSILKMFHRILKRAGLEQIRFHDLRHTFATLALQNGVDYKTLSGMLGHYSVAFTLDTYTHITPEMKRDAANRIGNVLAKADTSPQRIINCREEEDRPRANDPPHPAPGMVS